MRPRRPLRPRPPVRLISYRSSPPAVDGALALAADGLPENARPGAPPRRPPALRAVRPGGGLGPGEGAGPQGDLQPAGLVIARLLAEIIAGVRPLHHVAGRVTPDVYDRLARQMPVTRALGRRSAWPRIPAVRVQEPAPDVAEICAVVFTGPRVHAIALRLERFHGRWRCGAIETTLSPR